MAAIAFRRLAAADLQPLYLWLARPHVRNWYAPAPGSFAEVVAKYGPRTEDGCPVQAYIVNVDGADCGYIQTYRIDEFPEYAARLECAPGAAGIDLFIADSWRTNRGLGSEVVRRFVEEIVFGANAAGECVAGPAEGNLASIRTFEKAGFARWKTVKNERDEMECVMRRVREPA